MQTKLMSRLVSNLKSLFIRDGNIRRIIRIVLVIVGGGVVFLDLEVWHTGWVGIVGFVVGGVGGFASRAHQLGIRPFESRPYSRGWLKYRKPNRIEKKDIQTNQDDG